MPLQVDYTPVGAAGGLAAAAGYGEGQMVANQQMAQFQYRQHLQNMAEQRLGFREQALGQQAQLADQQLAWKQQAFELQQAHAERMLAERQRTPAADHVAERLQMQNDIRQQRQTDEMGQLDSMLQSGAITPEQHAQMKLGVMAGSSLVMSTAMKKAKPDISKQQALTTLLKPIREKRAFIQKQAAEASKNYFAMKPSEIEASVSGFQKQLDDLYGQENDLVGRHLNGEDVSSGSLPPGMPPDWTAQGQGSPLTREQAQSLLQQAGGDKDKARQMAKQQGFAF
jgi:hypothetical protein